MLCDSLRESVWIVDYIHEVGGSLQQKATIV
jgi:hypothetical protein